MRYRRDKLVFEAVRSFCFRPCSAFAFFRALAIGNVDVDAEKSCRASTFVTVDASKSQEPALAFLWMHEPNFRAVKIFATRKHELLDLSVCVGSIFRKQCVEPT